MAFVVGDQLTRYISILARKGAGKGECKVYFEPRVGMQREIRALLEANNFGQVINLIVF